MDTISGSGRIPRFPGNPGTGALLALIVTLPVYALQVTRYLRETSRQRRHLARLDDRLLRDIGLTRHEVDSDATKPFWRF